MGVEVTVLSAEGDLPGGAITKRFEKKEIFIGRMDTSDVVIDSPTVSDTHLKLFTEEADGELKVFVMDLDSTNGTAVERTPLVPGVATELPPMKRVLFANHLLKVTLLSDEVSDYLEDGLSLASEAVSALEGSPVQIAVETTKKSPPSGGIHLGGDTLVMKERTSIDEFDQNLKSGVQLSTSLAEITLREQESKQKGLETAVDLTAAPQTQRSLRSSLRSKLGKSKRLKAHPSKTVDTESVEVQMGKPQGSPGISQVQAAPKRIEQAQSKEQKASGSFFATVYVGSKGSVDLQIHASKLLTVRGLVQCDGQGLEGVEVDAGEYGTFITDSVGRFEIPGLIEGSRYALRLSKSGYLFVGDSPQGTLDADCELALEMLLLGTISGYVIHDGKPLGNVRVSADELGETETDEDGKFEFHGVPTNREYKLKIEKAGFQFSGGNEQLEQKRASYQ